MRRMIVSFVSFLALLLFAGVSYGDVVLLRQDCTGLSDCYTSMTTLVGDIWNTQTPPDPTESNPLFVDIGPGDFGVFSCPDGGATRNGWVTLRGSGRDQTRIVRSDGQIAGAVDINNCEKLHFQDLAIIGDVVGVQWKKGGSSTWTNVEIQAGADSGPSWAGILGIGWYDASSPCTEKPVHYFFSSRVRSIDAGNSNTGFISRCSENWFFGGEVTATFEENTTGSIQSTAIIIDQANGDFRAFGVAIRSNLTSASQAVASPPGVEGVRVQAGGVLHMHGGIINADASISSSNVDAMALNVTSSAELVHTPGTAFIAKAAGTGQATRASGPGSVVQSPFLWPQGAEPPRSVPGDPTSPFVASIQGADLFVETDCDGTGDCDSAGDEPHLMIQAPALCAAANPWFDVVMGACRQ